MQALLYRMSSGWKYESVVYAKGRKKLCSNIYKHLYLVLHRLYSYSPMDSRLFRQRLLDLRSVSYDDVFIICDDFGCKDKVWITYSFDRGHIVANLRTMDAAECVDGVCFGGGECVVFDGFGCVKLLYGAICADFAWFAGFGDLCLG